MESGLRLPRKVIALMFLELEAGRFDKALIIMAGPPSVRLQWLGSAKPRDDGSRAGF
jgi:hypothetical protein